MTTSTTKLIFYKAKGGNFFDKVVSFFDKGAYSHVEIVLSETDTLYYTVASSNRDGGVRFAVIQKSDHWDEVIVNESMVKDYHAYLGDGYDWIGLLHTIYDWWPCVIGRWVCSTFASEMFAIEHPKENGVQKIFLWAKEREVKLLAE